MFQRIVSSFENGLTAAQARVTTLQPTHAAGELPPAPVTPAPA